MPPAWTMEELEASIRRNDTFEGIADLFYLFFNVRISELDDFLKATAFFDRIRSGEDISLLEKFDFVSHLSSWNGHSTRNILTEEETELYERIKDETEKIDMLKMFQTEGEAFYKDKIAIPNETITNTQEKATKLGEFEEKARRDTGNEACVRAMESMKSDPRYAEIEKMPREGRANWNKANDACNALYTEHRKKVVAEMERDLPYYEELSELRKIVHDIREDTYKKVVDAIFDASPVTAEMAQEWAENNVYLADNARRKLNKGQYKADDIRSDMATIYRLLGGKLGPVEFILEGKGQRAFARGRFNISVNGDFNKVTLFHEVGHLAEHWDRAFQKTCKQFIEGRSTGKPKKLSTLTGNKRYGANEIAYPDHFIHPYVGKIYHGESSEVFSMCLQQLVDPVRLMDLMAKDPEHFKLLLAFCIRENPTLIAEAKKIQEDAAEEARIRKEQAEEEKAIRDAWKKELAGVANNKLFDALCREEGFEGYRIRASGNKYYPQKRSADTWDTVGPFESKTDILRRVYLFIADEKDLLPVALDEGDIYDILINIKDAPDWFNDKSQKLPRII